VNYTLAQDGDDLERRFWRLLSDHWPNYEVLWQLFIAPMTMRVYDRRNVALRAGIDSCLEQMCMAHYSIFYHLASAHELLFRRQREAELPQHYDDIFFHMSAATEMVERFLLSLCKLQWRIERQQPPDPFTVEEVVERAKEFHGKDYRKEYERHLQQGRSVNIRLHAVRDLIEPVLVRSDAQHIAAKLWRTANCVRSYRNVLAHNPLIPKLIGQGNVVYLPKEKKLSDYDLWSTASSGRRVESDYVAGPTLVSGLLGEFEGQLDELWLKLIPVLMEWRKTGEYSSMEPPMDRPHAAIRSNVRRDLRPPRRAPTGGSPFMPSGTSVVSDIQDWPEEDG